MPSGGVENDEGGSVLNTIGGDEDDGDDGQEPGFLSYIERAVPTKQDINALKMVEKCPVNTAQRRRNGNGEFEKICVVKTNLKIP